MGEGSNVRVSGPYWCRDDPSYFGDKKNTLTAAERRLWPNMVLGMFMQPGRWMPEQVGIVCDLTVGTTTGRCTCVGIDEYGMVHPQVLYKFTRARASGSPCGLLGIGIGEASHLRPGGSRVQRPQTGQAGVTDSTHKTLVAKAKQTMIL